MDSLVYFAHGVKSTVDGILLGYISGKSASVYPFYNVYSIDPIVWIVFSISWDTVPRSTITIEDEEM